MPSKTYHDNLTPYDELPNDELPASRLIEEQDALQAWFELQWSLASGFLTVPTLAIAGTQVTCTAYNGILGGKMIGGAGAWDLAGKPAGVYYLQKTNADAFATPATTQDVTNQTCSTVSWNGSTLSSLATTASVGIRFTGDSGALSQWVPRGTWTTAFAYRGNNNYRDVVAYNGSSYVAKSDHTSGASSEPGVGASWQTYWQLLASKGATGNPGPAGGLTNPRGAWLSGVAYDATKPDTVIGADGHGYQCISSHTSGAASEPGTGGSWTTYWARYVLRGATGATGDPGEGFNAAGTWATSTAYAITPNIDWVTHNGNSYACKVAHTSGATTEPGVGADWETYWQQFAQKGAPGDPMDWQSAWVTGTAYTEGQGVNRLGSSYYCKLAHTAGASNEPGVGASWLTYWDYLALKGTDGTNGHSVLNGSGAPGAGSGTDGDFYIDTTAWQIYGPKASGDWGSGTALVGVGVDGQDGKGFNLRDAWLTATSYAADPNYDVVSNNGSAYACKLAHTSGSDDDEPGVGANWGNYWSLLVVSAGGISIVTSVNNPGSDANIPSEKAVRTELNKKSDTTHNHTGTYDPAGTAASAVSTHEAAYTHHKDNDAATTAPGVTDDAADGYTVGSHWLDTTADTAYICLDATEGAAVWHQIDAAGGGPLGKYDATAAPTVNDDTGDGYSVGSLWVDTTNDHAYICVDATLGAAVWLQIDGSTVDLSGYATMTTAEVRYVVATDGNDANAGTAVAITGTVAIGSAYAVTGTGTSFTTQLSVGDYIVVANETRKIGAITSNTALTVTASWSGTSSGNTLYRCTGTLLTIGAAVAKIPTIVNHNLYIYIAPGTYSEAVDLRGYAGKGCIYLYGATSATTTHTITSLYALNVACQLQVHGLQANTTSTHGFWYVGCTYVFQRNGYSVGATSSSYAGVTIESGAFVNVSAGTYSNKGYGVIVTAGGLAATSTVGGTGNTYGIAAIDGGEIRKRNATVPAGGTAELYASGGLIVGSTGGKVGSN